MTSEIRVMAIFQGGSGKPEDQVVNTFHFTGATTFIDDQALAMTAVTKFYNGSGTGSHVGTWLSPWLKRSAELRAYDMSLEKPAGAPKHWRVPVTALLTLNAADSDQGLPEEVACCITMHGVVPPALSGRRRGRLYIGPLNTICATAGSSTTPARPNVSFLGVLAADAAALIASSSEGIVWSIMSEKPSKNFVRVAAGYVDNAWDTQRRRGPDSTLRTGFGFPEVGP